MTFFLYLFLFIFYSRALSITMSFSLGNSSSRSLRCLIRNFVVFAYFIIFRCQFVVFVWFVRHDISCVCACVCVCLCGERMQCALCALCTRMTMHVCIFARSSRFNMIFLALSVAHTLSPGSRFRKCTHNLYFNKGTLRAHKRRDWARAAHNKNKNKIQN